jgi:hypothetical protein
MNDHNLQITIKSTQGTWDKATFPKTAKIEELITAVKQHFNYAQNGNYELRQESDPNTPLKPERPLVSYGIKDGDVLRFTDLGGGV